MDKSTKISVFFSLLSARPETLANLQSELLANKIDVEWVQQLPRESKFDFCVTVERTQVDRVRTIIAPQCGEFELVDAEGDLLFTHSVPWFPRATDDLDEGSKHVFSLGVELNADHPGFLDPCYRERRLNIVALTQEYRIGTPIPEINYTAAEVQTWNTCFNSLLALYPTHACDKYNSIRDDMFAKCGYRVDNVPQLEDVSNYLRAHSGFRIRPVGGLLSPRAFLAGLAFKVYHATQYMRHESRPFYTPEPDVCHELIGHLPLFADPQFADFVQQIGLASLGAPDEYTERLSTCLWFTVEFGLCREHGELRAFGGGLLSSVEELQYALSDRPEVREFDPIFTGEQPFPITEFQPVYYAAQSIERARDQMIEYAATIPRSFMVEFNESTDRIVVTPKETANIGQLYC